MKKITCILLLAVLMFSCKKEDDQINDNFTVILNQSGNLSIKVIESNGNAAGDAPVRVYSSVPEGLIYSDTTDAQGICNIGKLLQGHYSYRVSSTINNKLYTESQNFQIIAGDSKTIIVNPFLNIT